MLYRSSHSPCVRVTKVNLLHFVLSPFLSFPFHYFLSLSFLFFPFFPTFPFPLLSFQFHYLFFLFLLFLSFPYYIFLSISSLPFLLYCTWYPSSLNSPPYFASFSLYHIIESPHFSYRSQGMKMCQGSQFTDGGNAVVRHIQLLQEPQFLQTYAWEDK